MHLAERSTPTAPQAIPAGTSPPVHGGLLLALLVAPLFVRELRQWPWYLLAPLAAYLMVVALVPALRRTVRWNRLGVLHGWVLVATAAIVVLSGSALLLYDAVYRPDLGELKTQLPLAFPLHAAVLGALFAACNALLEEVVFRGVLLDALTSAVGPKSAVLVQAVVFGAAHARGYPPGALGMALAGVYGLMLGLLRQRSGGLAAPWVAHVFADAIIFWIVATRPL